MASGKESRDTVTVTIAGLVCWHRHCFFPQGPNCLAPGGTLPFVTKIRYRSVRYCKRSLSCNQILKPSLGYRFHVHNMADSVHNRHHRA
jgi:hypothetical protein